MALAGGKEAGLYLGPPPLAIKKKKKEKKIRWSSHILFIQLCILISVNVQILIHAAANEIPMQRH